MLSEREAHVWYAYSHDAGSAGVLSCYRSLLNEEEVGRAARYRFDDDRTLYVLGRALVRTTLSRYANVNPSDWTFTVNEHGKPSLGHGERPRTLPAAWARLRFNLTHTRGLVACIVALDSDVGIDFESTARRLEHESLAPAILQPEELLQLGALPPDRQRRRFLQHWTLKEAYLKSLGVGLSGSLRDARFCVDELREGQRTSARLSPLSSKADERWQFESMALGRSHIGAIAIRTATHDPLAIAVRQAVLPIEGCG